MDKMDDATFSDPSNANGTNDAASLEPTESTESTDAAGAAPGFGSAVRPTFLSELAHAMQSAAGRERERIAVAVSEDAATHVEKVRSRAAIETEELRRLADDDVARIEEWSASEIARVKAEAAKKVDDRRMSLDGFLKQHDAIIETEIEGVDTAVREYSLTLDRFFEGLADSNDPSEIVRRAEALPPPPDLDQVRDSARTNAMALFAEPAPSAPAVGQDAAVQESGAGPTDGQSMATEGGPTETAPIKAWPAEIEASAETSETQPTSEAQPTGEASEAPASSGWTEGRDATESGEEVRARAVAVAVEGDEDQRPAPVGVMDPSATDGPAWPATDERQAVAQTVDHTSAAVRLLRSVAPWTAPTHAGDHRPPPGSD